MLQCMLHPGDSTLPNDWPLFKLSWRWETHYLLQFPVTSTLAVTKFPSVPGAQWQALPVVTIQKKGTEKNRE